MKEQNDTKGKFSMKNLFIKPKNWPLLALIIGLWGLISWGILIHLLENTGEGILIILLIVPFVSIPMVIYYLFEKNIEIKDNYRFYQSKLDSLINIIFKSGMINEIDDSERKEVELLEDIIELRDSPKLISGYFEHLFLGLIMGLIIGSFFYLIGEFIMKTILSI